MRRGVGRIGQMVHLGRLAQAVQHDARLDRGQLAPPDRSSSARSCSARSRTPRPRWRTARPGWCPRRAAARRRRSRGRRPARPPHRPRRAGRITPTGKLAVVRRVGGVERAGAEVEADVAAQRGLEQGFEFAVGGKALMVERRLVGEDRECAHAGMLARCASRVCRTVCELLSQSDTERISNQKPARRARSITSPAAQTCCAALLVGARAAAAEPALAAAAGTGTAARAFTGVGTPAAFGNCARAAADEPFHCSATLRACFHGRVRHLLTLIKAACTCLALIFVCWHLEST